MKSKKQLACIGFGFGMTKNIDKIKMKGKLFWDASLYWLRHMIAAKHPVFPSTGLCHHNPELLTKTPVHPSLKPPADSSRQGGN